MEMKKEIYTYQFLWVALYYTEGIMAFARSDTTGSGLASASASALIWDPIANVIITNFNILYTSVEVH